MATTEVAPAAAAVASWLPAIFALLITSVIGWGAWVTLRIMAFNASAITREEHAAICDKKDIELNRKMDKLETALTGRLDTINKAMEKQENVATEFRHGLNNALMEMKTTLAVLNSGNSAPPRRRP